TPTPHARRTPSAQPKKTASATPSASAVAPTGAAAPSASSRPVAASIRLSPAQGPRGTTFTVTGHGWAPGATVTLRYSGSLSSSSTTTTVDSRGQLDAQLTANGALPGTYTVQADDITQHAQATFRQTA